MTMGMPPGASAPAGSPQAGAPSGAQMATPQAKLGEQAKAKASIEMAMRVLYATGVAFDPMSEESKAIRKAVDTLTKAFGATQHEGRELVPAEIASLMSGMSPPGPQGRPSAGIQPGTPGATPPTAAAAGGM